jgi:hypothetical protein
MAERITALFDHRHDAERAVDALRAMGVDDGDISVVAQDRHGHPGVDEFGDGFALTHTEATDEVTDAGERAAKGAAAGAGAGALFGLAALAIPGVGPFITAGWLAAALGVAGGAVASGAIVGGTSGALAGLLTRAGYDREEADYYGSGIERGGLLVAVDTGGGMISSGEAKRVLEQNGGHLWENHAGDAGMRIAA